MINKKLCPVFVLASCLTAQAQTPEQADLLISADYVVTMDEADTVISDGAVAVRDGVIIAVGSADTIRNRYQAGQDINEPDSLLMPGLINGHTHAAMTLFRGIADDMELMDWLTQYIFPAEIRFVDEHFIRVGTQLACLEMIKGGTTTFVDMYFHPQQIAEVVNECGLRAVIGAAVIEQESGYTTDFADAMAKAESFIRRWKDKNSRITPAIAPHATYTIGPKNLKTVRARANAHGVPVVMHISESQTELQLVNEAYNNTPIKHLQEIGFLNGATIGAHIVWPTAEEIPLLVKYGVGAIHNPGSNMKMAAGLAPVPALLRQGVRVGLGTDGAASNNDLDMWEEIRLAALLHKGHSLNPEIMPAGTVLQLATRGGAGAVGLGNSIGSLVAGRRADLILVSLDAAHLVPLYDVISHLVYAVDAQDVQTVIVDGKVLMHNRQVLTLNEKTVIAAARAIAARIDQAIR
ncbi:MAG: amidohydrolase family protein [Gammaproteobacteria bacterium]